MRNSLFPIILLLLAGCTGATTTDRPVTGLYQVSTLQTLMQGGYDGSLRVGQLKTYGDTGLGTFNALHGEMVVLDGVVYQVTVDGKVQTAKDEWTTPFANVAHLNADAPASVIPLETTGNLEQMEALILQHITNSSGANRPWVIRLDGAFTGIQVRSVPRQTKPYPPLAVAAKAQKAYSHETAEGSVVGFYFPDYMKGINVAGFHTHFLSTDKTIGGHLLSLRSARGELHLRPLPSFKMILPDTVDGVDLTSNMEKEIHAVERAQETR